MHKRQTFFAVSILLFFAYLLPIQAQSVPGLSAPVNGSTWDSTTPTLYWWYVPTPYSAGPFTYSVQVSTSSSNFTGGYLKVDASVSGSGAASYSVTSGAGLTSGVTYYWRVGVGGNYSTVYSWTPGGGSYSPGSAPLTPTLISPANAATIVSTSPTFSWNSASGATTYNLQVSVDSLFGTTVINESGIAATTFGGSGLSNSTLYYWRVSATNTYGTSAYSTVFHFTTEAAATPPAVPTLASPADAATNVSNHPTLAWHPASGASTYTLLVSTDNTFTSVNFTFTGIADTSYHIHNWPSDYLQLSTTYYWKVRSTNGAGTSAFSSTWSFSTKPDPDVPELISPANLTTGLSRVPTFVWTPEFDADSYDLQLATNSAFTTGLVSYTGITDTFKVITTPLAANTTYFWRVRANGPSSSAYSAYWKFKTVVYTTWYVRTTGLNTNSGLQEDDPFLTIQKAIDSASDGDHIDVGAGTFTEDLTIDVDNLEIFGTGYSNSTTIKGVAQTALASFPLAVPNIEILANGVSIHDFIIESPDVADHFYSSGIVFTGTDLELYNINFHSVITSSVNTVDPNVDHQGDGYAIVMQSYYAGIAPSPYTGVEDISGLSVHDNYFTSTASGAGTPSYEGIFLNYDANTSGVTISNNQFSGNLYRGIASMVDGITIDHNSIVSDISSFNKGIRIYEGDNAAIENNFIQGFDGDGTLGSGTALGLGGGWGSPRLDALTATYNEFTGNEEGVDLAVNFFTIANPVTTLPVFNNNSFHGNSHGMRVDHSTGDHVNYTINAENNYWGSVDGPADATYFSGPEEVVLGTPPLTNIVNWENAIAENVSTLGNAVVDNATATGSGGLYIDYYPWNTGQSALMVGSSTTVTGATVSIPINFASFGASFQTLQGKFTYDTAKLDFVSATYGTGTLVNSSGWTVLFTENPAGTVNFVGVGFTPIDMSGVLFKLNFKVIATSAGSANISVNTGNWIVDGTSSVWLTTGGTITYTFQQYTYLRGDVNLDGTVTVQDALLLDQYLSTLINLTQLQLDNADADLDGNLDSDDVSAILYFVLNGSWAAPPPAPSVVQVGFGTAQHEDHGLLAIPIQLNGSSNVRNVEMIVNYDKKAMDFQTFSQLVKKAGHYVEATKIVDGVARFTYAAPTGQEGDITPGVIVMKLKNSGYEGGPITTYYKINGGSFQPGPSISADGVTAVATEEIPTEFNLSQNYPNPFNPTTNIRYSLPEASYVSLKIYNMLGQEVKTLFNGDKAAGIHEITWNGDDNFGSKVSSGAYVYRIVAGKHSITKKMLLLK
jgi:hypothetical protein